LAIGEPAGQIDDPAGDPVERLLLEYARTAVLLQRLAGHRVDQTAVIRNSGDGNLHVLWEHEDSDVGRVSGMLALRLICMLEPGLVVRYHRRVEQNTILPGPADLPFQEQLGRFLDDARSRLLPIETQALIDAARRRNIPCIKLDREPYEGISGDFRIRPNAMARSAYSVQRICHR
jgi:hypothetical protein